MKNQFIPYSLALKLKELGFDEETMGFWVGNGPKEGRYVHPGNEHLMIIGKEIVRVPAVLWQQAFDFLLTRYSLYAVIIPTVESFWTFKTITCTEGQIEVPPYEHVHAEDYLTYEHAREACLEKMIELIQNETT